MRRNALAILLFLVGAAAARNSTYEDKCGPDAAFDQFMSTYGTASRFAEFRVLLKVANLKRYLQSISRGKAIIIPTNGQMQQLIRDAGIVTVIPYYGEVNKPGFETSLTMGQVKGLKRLLATFIVSRQQLITRFRGQPCDLLAFTHDYLSAVATMQQISPIRRQPWPAQPNAPPPSTSSGGSARKLLQNGGEESDGSLWPDSLAVSMQLGFGYNTLTAWPLTTSMASSDPGFDAEQIFDFSMPLLGGQNTWFVTVNSGCVSNQQEMASYSQFDSQQQQAMNIGLSGGYKKSAFAANANFQTDLNNMHWQASYVVAAGSYVNNATFSMQPLGYVNFTTGFLEQVNSIYSAVQNNSPDLQAALQQFVTSYGTHYVQQITSGAISRIFTRMSSSSNAQLENNGINVSASASVTYKAVTAGGSGGGSSSTSNNIVQSSYQENVFTQTVPSGLSYTTDSDGIADCNTWTASLQSQGLNGNYAKLLGTSSLLPIASLFTHNGNASQDVFPLWWPSNFTNEVLQQVAEALENFIVGCQGTGGLACYGINTTCNAGSFNNGDVENPCQSCYTSGNMCNPYTTQYCSNTTGECECLNPGEGPPWRAMNPWQGSNCAEANTGACNAYFNAPKNQCYQSSAYVGDGSENGDEYGYGCPYGYVGNPTNCGDETECFCRCWTNGMEQYWWDSYNNTLTNSYVVPGTPSLSSEAYGYPNPADYAGPYGSCGNDANTGSCPGHVDYCSCPSPGGWGNGCNPLFWYENTDNMDYN